MPELQGGIEKQFGLRIPQGALSTILNRAARRNYVIRDRGIYRRNDEALTAIDLSRTREDVLGQYEALIGKLGDFAKAKYAVDLTTEEADAALLAYLEEGSAAVLSGGLDGAIVPAGRRASDRSRFLAAAFVAHLAEADPTGFDFFTTIVKGSMLAGVLLFPDLGEVERRFQDVEVFFDTAFILQALGLEGASKQDPRRELLDLLYEENATLWIFEHTLDEIRSVLEAAAVALRAGPHPRHGDTIQYLIDHKFSPSDVELAIARLEKSINSLRIRVRQKPATTVPLSVDELKLRDVLDEEVHYHRQDTLDRDVDSLTAIHRLRQGRLHRNIETCDAIFVTTNHSMARGGARFFREEYASHQDWAIPYCILDHVFTTLVWLKKPLRAPDLPRKRIIADCYAALNPPDALWRRYQEETQRLRVSGEINEDDYYLLRYSVAARNALMERTLGDSEAFTEGTLVEVLEAARRAERADADEALAKQAQERQAAERRAEEAEAATERVRAEYEARRLRQGERIRALANRVGRIVGLSTLMVALCVVFIGAYFPLLGLDGPSEPLGPVVVAAVFALVSLATVHLVFGASLRSLIRGIEVRVAHEVERLLTRMIGE